MSFTESNVVSNNIASLDNEPNDVGGLTPEQLKAKFDKYGTDNNLWFNGTHLPELREWLNYYTDTGTANALVITPNPAFTSYTSNMTLLVKVANVNNGACTINVNGLGAKSIKKDYDVDLPAGDLKVGQIIQLKWDGTNFQIVGSLVNEFRSNYDFHVAVKGSSTGPGHVSVDNSTVKADVNGVLSAEILSKITFFTRDISLASGTQAITGVGFRPKAVIFFANVSNTSAMSVGFDNATGKIALADANASVANTYALDGAKSIYIITSGSNYYQGSLASLDTDGFTINWVKTGSPTGTAVIGYLAIR